MNEGQEVAGQCYCSDSCDSLESADPHMQIAITSDAQLGDSVIQAGVNCLPVSFENSCPDVAEYFDAETGMCRKCTSPEGASYDS